MKKFKIIFLCVVTCLVSVNSTVGDYSRSDIEKFLFPPKEFFESDGSQKIFDGVRLHQLSCRHKAILLSMPSRMIIIHGRLE